MNDTLIDRLLSRAQRCTQRARTLARHNQTAEARSSLERAKLLLALASQARIASAVSQLSENQN